jgi:hypothetical protein
MTKASDRLTDYALVGGFFWILQLGLAAVIGSTRMGSTHWFQSATAALRDLLQAAPSPLVALLSALGLIAIFVTGLVLDLLGAFYLRVFEVGVFLYHLDRNEHWLGLLADQNKDYVQGDIATLHNALAPLPAKRGLAILLKCLVPRNRELRQEVAKKLRENWALLSPYSRMQSFLLSYVLLGSGAEKIELLSTQISLWSISRAVSTVMLLVGMESAFALAFVLPSYLVTSWRLVPLELAAPTIWLLA